MINWLNPIFHTDFYKTGHGPQYPDGTEYVYSNMTPRSDKIARRNGDVLSDFDGRVAWVGIQGVVKEYLIETFNTHFFGVTKEEACNTYASVMDNALGPNVVGISHWEDLHDLGYLPIKIKALAEGTRVPVGVPMFTIVNTHESFFWLVNYLETVLSAELWQSCTSATIAYEYKRLLTDAAIRTGVDPAFVPIQGHDFSFRGLSSRFSAVKSAIGHMTSFIGTDTVPAIPYLMQYYNATNDIMPIGVSVPATEHSVMCLGGKDGEIETFRRLIQDQYKSGIVSIVSDTWDYWQVLTEFTVKLKDEILNRRPDALGNCKTVFRPDSGDPVKIVAGLKVLTFSEDKPSYYILEAIKEGYEAVLKDGKYYEIKDFSFGTETEIPEHVVKGSVEVLWDIFGGTETDKGFKVLNDKVGLIYGDSITINRAEQILARLEAKGFASSNIVFGIGSYTYQYNTRDTFGFAIKATWGQVNEEPREIFKDPKTDDGTKKSAKGLLRVDNRMDAGGLFLQDQCTVEEEEGGLLETIFENGVLAKEVTFDEIRETINK